MKWATWYTLRMPLPFDPPDYYDTDGLLSDDERLVVTVKANGTIFVQRSKVGLKDLETKMRTIFETRGNKEVFLRADTKVAYGKVAKTLSALRRAGATRVGMVTEPDV